MKRRALCGLLAVLLALTLNFVAVASGGDSSDPVVSKSYLDVEFFNRMISYASEKLDGQLASIKTKYFSSLNKATSVSYSGEQVIELCADAVLERLQSEGKYLYSTGKMSPKSLDLGDVIVGKSGTMVIVVEGTSKCSSGSVINITQGKEVYSGYALGRSTTFMFPESGGEIEITSNTAKVLIDGVYAMSDNGYRVKYMDEAYALKKLGLVRGAANGMELYRGNNRAESITMLIRLLGEEKNSLAGGHSHPFTDVDAWAQDYVGYAYRMGYTKGVSNTKYDGSSMTTAIQYMTFVLRSLGYSEEQGDFTYLTAVDDAVRLGVIDSATAREIKNEPFKRDHVMHISYLAMWANVKGQNKTLLQKLVDNGAVTYEAYEEFIAR